MPTKPPSSLTRRERELRNRARADDAATKCPTCGNRMQMRRDPDDPTARVRPWCLTCYEGQTFATVAQSCALIPRTPAETAHWTQQAAKARGEPSQRSITKQRREASR